MANPNRFSDVDTSNPNWARNRTDAQWKLVFDLTKLSYPCMLVRGEVVHAYFTDRAYGMEIHRALVECDLRRKDDKRDG